MPLQFLSFEVKTGLSFLHRKFINECPSGLITLHEFQRHFCNGTVGSESAEYAEQIFRTLDTNGVRIALNPTIHTVSGDFSHRIFTDAILSI